jgi:hypothetical protein
MRLHGVHRDKFSLPYFKIIFNMRNHNSLKESIEFLSSVVEILLFEANHILMYIIYISHNLRDTIFSILGAFLSNVESLLPRAESNWG